MAVAQLIAASASGDIATVKRLLLEGVDVNGTNEKKATSLYVASQKGHHNVVQALLGGGADVKRAVSDGRTPLWAASYDGHLEIVVTLIEAGADVNQTNKNNWSPLWAACYSGHLDVVITLIEAGADVTQQDENGKTPVDIAVEKCHEEIIELLKSPQIKKGLTALRAQIAQERVKVKNAEMRAAIAEQQLQDLKQQVEQQKLQLQDVKQQKEHIALQAHLDEERATRAEQQLRDMRLQNEQTVLQAQRAEERARQAEQQFRIFRQQADAHQSAAMSDQRNRLVQKNPDYLKSSWRVHKNEIHVTEEKPLGVGGWGVVKVATFCGLKVAVKFIHEEIISPYNIDKFNREMNIAASVRHPNLLLFIGASLEDNKPVIITELMQTNLRSVIEVKALLQDQVISISTDIACGLNYLHLMKPDPIIHRDVSSANVLLEPIGSGNWRAKVSDYGSANFLSLVTTTGPGNVVYTAPESYNPKLQSPKMDVYSFGILLLEMATGQFPDHDIRAVQLETLLWQKMAEMVRRCIHDDPSHRPHMKDVLLSLPRLCD